MNHPTEKAEQLGRAKLYRYAQRIINDIEKDIPSCILAGDVMLLWDAGMLACGDDLIRAWGSRQIVRTRDAFGLCQNCDTEINPSLTHPPVCEQCDAKDESEAKRIDEDLKKGEDIE